MGYVRYQQSSKPMNNRKHQTTKPVVTSYGLISRTLGTNNLLQQDNVGVFETLQKLDFPQSCNREPIFFLFRVDTFEGDDFVRDSITCHKNAPVGTFSHLFLLLEYVHIPHYNGSTDRYGSTPKLLGAWSDRLVQGLLIQCGNVPLLISAHC